MSDFVGAGRGYRWLQFLDSKGLPLQQIQQISEADVVGAEILDRWALVVNHDGGPLGWIDAHGVERMRGGGPLSDSLIPVGTVISPVGNLSQALDAALSSASAMGVAVDDTGKVIGTVQGADILAAARSHRVG